MANPSPLREFHETMEAEWLTLAPVETDCQDGNSSAIVLVATYREIEAEYAAIRKSVGLLDLPHRGTIQVRGKDAVDFLNRMLTNDIKAVSNGHAVRAFFLSRQGRILSDQTLFTDASENEGVYLDLDFFLVQDVMTALDGYLFGEDVELVDVSSTLHRLALHGPRSLELLGRIIDGTEGDWKVEQDECKSVIVDNETVVVLRRDSAGEVGLELTCPTELVGHLHRRLLTVGADLGVRPIGWMAYNMARIETGTPLFQIDFGIDSLPHETGELLRSAVSFNKGCYPGQEIVARMESRGHPSKILVGVRITGESIPTTGAPILEVVGEEGREQGGDVVGAVTSAAPSPMLGNVGIAFAMIKYDCATIGTNVLTGTDDGALPGLVQGLQFWPVVEPD